MPMRSASRPWYAPKYKYTRGKRVKKAGVRRKAKLSKPLKRAIVSAIRREEETKLIEFSSSISLGAYGTTVSTQGFIPLIPYTSYCAINQGTGEADRIGNQIRIVKAKISYIINPNGYNAVSNPVPIPQDVIVRIFALKDSGTLVNTAPNYFENNNSSSNPTGTLLDYTRRVNTELYTQYKMMTHKVAAAVNTGGGNAVNQSYYANNDYKYNVIRTIDYTKLCPKLIRFNDNTSLPTCRILQTFIESVNADTTSQAAAYIPATMSYTVSIWYKDA